MNVNIFKLVIIFLLSTLLAVYTNCGKPSNLMFKNGYYAGGSEASYAAFQESVYSLTRSNCVSCHSSIQPMHASDNYREAHDILVSQNKVNFNNIQNSRLVMKLRNENHNCWSSCEENAKEMEAAIAKWGEARANSGTEEVPPTDSAIYTTESDTIEMEFADAGNPPKSNTVKLNVEAAMKQSPMTLVPAEDGPFLTVVNNNLNTTLAADATGAGLAYMNFKVPTTGSYRLWGLVNGPTDQDNSFFVNVRESKTTISLTNNTRIFDFTSGARFEWRMLRDVTMNLMANREYTLELRQREDGARAQAFVITSDTTFNGQEVGDFFGITLSFDLAPRIPGASFKVDVVDYDLYSYKLTKPRIVASESVKVKNIKLFVNGEYSPQHSAYTLVDKITTSTDNILSNYAMIVLKDKGLEADRFKFSFEELYSTTSTGTTTAGTGGADASSETSLMAYQATMYPISRSSAYSCVGCHTSTNPRHASDNVQTAHDAVLGVVDFNTPENSRIVRKMRTERHNCGANCDNIATQFETAIKEWRTRRP